MTVSEALQSAWPMGVGEMGPGKSGGALASALIKVAEDDLEGARAVLTAWCETAPSQPGGHDDVISLAVMLLDQVGDLMEAIPGNSAKERGERIDLGHPRRFEPSRDEYTFTVSTHLSLLTAAVVRQRAQIVELLDLVETLSRRLA